MSDPVTLTIGSATTHLIPPKSPTVRLELIQALPGDGSVSVRLAAAAVALCWPGGPTKPRTRYTGDVSAFGLAVADELYERGCTYPDLMRAGVECLQAIAALPLTNVGTAREASRPFEPAAPPVA